MPVEARPCPRRCRGWTTEAGRALVTLQHEAGVWGVSCFVVQRRGASTSPALLLTWRTRALCERPTEGALWLLGLEDSLACLGLAERRLELALDVSLVAGTRRLPDGERERLRGLEEEAEGALDRGRVGKQLERTSMGERTTERDVGREGRRP